MTPGRQAGEMEWTPDWDIVYHSPKPGRLSLSTAFLFSDWADASYEAAALWDKTGEALLGHSVHIEGAPGEIELLHNESGLSLEWGGLATGGQSLIRYHLRGDEAEVICYVGGQDIRVRLPQPPAEVLVLSEADGPVLSEVEGTGLAGHTLTRGDAWDWIDTELFIYGGAQDAQCVRVMPRQ
jgi:hypothetical protein